MTNDEQGRLSRLLALFDFHVQATLLLRVWTIAAGFLTVLAVPYWLSAEEQGFYFSFGSLIALQLFFELGLSYVVTQHTAAQLPFLSMKDGRIIGENVNVARVARLLYLTSRAYAVIALIFFISVGTAGTWFFASAKTTSVSWSVSWWLMVLMTAGNLLVSPWLATAQGLGRVGDVARIRTYQSIVGYVIAWTLMANGFGLFALPAITAASFAGSLFWLYFKAKDIRHLASKGNEPNARTSISWRHELLPFQWRIAVSWMSGYFIFQLFTPITFYLFGAIAAGQIGFLMAITNSLSTLSMSWVHAKAPRITSLLANSEKPDAKALFRVQTIAASTSQVVAMTALIAVTVVAKNADLAWADRLPSIGILFSVALASICNQIIFSMAVFIRAHGVEALMWPTILTGFLTIAMLTVLAPVGISAAMVGYAALQASFCLPWVAWIFFTQYWNPDGYNRAQDNV